MINFFKISISKLDKFISAQFIAVAIALSLFMVLFSAIGLCFGLSKVMAIAILLLSFALSFLITKINHFEIENASFLGLIFFGAIFCSLSAVILPPFINDEVAYGVTIPKFYVEHKKISYFADYGFYSAFPQNYEALVTSSLLVFDSLIWVKFINIWFALGFGYLTYLIARLIKISKALSIFASILVLTTNAFIFYIPIIKNDIANAFFQLMAIYFLLRCSIKPKEMDFYLASLFAGVAVGIKYTSILFLIVSGALLVWIIFFLKDEIKIKVKILGISFFIFILFCGSWYFRNWIEFGNPIYPVYNSLWSSASDIANKTNALISETFTGDENFNWKTGHANYFFINLAKGLGFTTLGLGMLYSLFRVFVNRKDSVFIVALFNIMFICLAMRFGPWESRYYFILLSINSILVVSLLDKLSGDNHKLQTIVAVSLSSYLILSSSFQEMRYISNKVSTFISSKNDFFLKNVADWNTVSWINRNVPDSKRVAFFGLQPFYYLNPSFFLMQATNEKSHVILTDSDNGLALLLRSEQIDYICLKKNREISRLGPNKEMHKIFISNLNKQIDELKFKGYLEEVSEVDDNVIYRVSIAN